MGGRPAWPVLLSLGFIAFIILFCFAGPHVYATDQVNANLADYLCRPSAAHPLGCDDLGHDELGRLMAGGQVSLEVGLAAAAVSVLAGTVYGAVSGFAGGLADAVMMRLVDAGQSLPSLMVLIIASVIFRPTPGVIIVIIAAFSWLGVARLVRAEALTLREREFVRAVRLFGGGPLRSVLRHVIPNAAGTVTAAATFAVADSILALSALGFLGLGIAPPATDWGSMLSDGLSYLQGSDYWWLIYPPGIAIIATCVAFNYVSEALRDGLDTRLLARAPGRGA